MKFHGLILSILLAGSQAQSSPHEHYDSICPAQNGQIEEISPGYQVKYKCDFVGSYGAANHRNINTPEQCAVLCRDSPACSGSTWAYENRQCRLSGTAGRARAYLGALYMEKVEEDLPAPEPTEERHVRTCPAISDRLSLPKADAQIVANPRCPNDNGNMFVTDDGAHYTLLCCTHNPNGNSEIPNTRSTASSFRECATRCSSTNGCQSYVFSARANNQDELGTCKLYSTGSFQTTKCGDDTHDYAYITAPPAMESPDRAGVACATECPSSDGQQYTSKGGELFHMDCAKRHGTRVLLEDTQETFKDCMDACSKFIPCHSVDYHTNSKTCYYSNHHGEPEIVASGFQSAHSQGCSGACNNQHKNACCEGQSSNGQEASTA